MLINIGYLNQAQAKGLSTFFFDLAKTLVFGAVASNVISIPILIKLLANIVNVALVMGCLKIALDLLNKEN